LEVNQKELELLRARLYQNIIRMKIRLIEPRIVGRANEFRNFLDGAVPD